MLDGGAIEAGGRERLVERGRDVVEAHIEGQASRSRCNARSVETVDR